MLMDRDAMLAWFGNHGIEPAVAESSYGGKRVEPSVHTCTVCGGYRSLYLPALADDGTGCKKGPHYVDPGLAFAYAAYGDELLEAAGGHPYRQLDRGACTCDHEHAWEHVAKLGSCYNRYRCTVPGCGAVNDVDSSG